MSRARALWLAALALALPVGVAELAGSGVERLGFPGTPLPDRLGDYRAVREQYLDADSLRLIRPTAYWFREYEADATTPGFAAYVAAYSGVDPNEAHDPTICYPAQGWEVADSHWVEIPLGDELLRARELVVEKGPFRQHVVYWFQRADRWPQTAWLEPFARLWDRARGRPQYAFVRLSSFVETPGSAWLRAVAAELAPGVRAQLEAAVPAGGA